MCFGSLSYNLICVHVILNWVFGWGVGMGGVWMRDCCYWCWQQFVSCEIRVNHKSGMMSCPRWVRILWIGLNVDTIRLNRHVNSNRSNNMMGWMLAVNWWDGMNTDWFTGVDWLMDWVTDWLNDRLIYWLINWWCLMPRQPLQNHSSGLLGGWAMPWSAEEMLDGQHQRLDIPAPARTAHKSLLQRRLDEDLCWIVLRVPPPTQSVKGPNWTEQLMMSCFRGAQLWQPVEPNLPRVWRQRLCWGCSAHVHGPRGKGAPDQGVDRGAGKGQFWSEWRRLGVRFFRDWSQVRLFRFGITWEILRACTL